MKVVINSCYGGFGLSKKAKLKLYELGSPIIEASTPEEYYGKDWKVLMAEDKMWLKPTVAPDGKIISTDSMNHEARACPYLIKVVQKMKHNANGEHAKLSIVEIPDDIEYTIQDYGGIEWIAEKHRTWQ
jgi:hypothetical protein